MDLKKLLKDQIYFKILSFFNENPSSIDTPRGIATWIGESRQDADKALFKLAKLNYLIAHKTTSTMGYSYTRDLKLIKKIRTALTQIKK